MTDANLPDALSGVFLVTGGLGRLGQAISVEVERRGGTPILTSRRADAVDEFNQRAMNEGIEARAVQLQFSDRVQVSTALDDVIKRFGPLSGLVNNAYAALPFMSVEEVDWASWAESAVVNIGYAHTLSVESVKRDAKAIVNVSSIYAMMAPDFSIYGPHGEPSPVVYGPMKAALIQLTRYLAVYWAEHGVRVNCVSPGGIENNQSEPFRGRYQARIPQRRFVDAAEVAAVIGFLLSSQASGMTGENVVVDAGLHAW